MSARSPRCAHRRDACTARDGTPIDEGHVSDAALAHACSHQRTAAAIQCPKSETHVELSPAIGHVAGAHRSTDLTYKEMLGPPTKALQRFQQTRSVLSDTRLCG